MKLNLAIALEKKRQKGCCTAGLPIVAYTVDGVKKCAVAPSLLLLSPSRCCFTALRRSVRPSQEPRLAGAAAAVGPWRFAAHFTAPPPLLWFVCSSLPVQLAVPSGVTRSLRPSTIQSSVVLSLCIRRPRQQASCGVEEARERERRSGCRSPYQLNEGSEFGGLFSLQRRAQARRASFERDRPLHSI